MSKDQAQRDRNQQTKLRVEEQASVWKRIFLGQVPHAEAVELVALHMLRDDIELGGGKKTRNFSAQLLAHIISAKGGTRQVKPIQTLQADLLKRLLNP